MFFSVQIDTFTLVSKTKMLQITKYCEIKIGKLYNPLQLSDYFFDGFKSF